MHRSHEKGARCGEDAMTTLEDLKAEAKRLRSALAATGQAFTHSQSLEMLAKQKGYRDWNTLHAAIGNQPPRPPVDVGQTVDGAYLGHAVRGEILAVRRFGDGRYRIKLDLEAPVDVSAFEGMEVLRRRLNANIGGDGATIEKTSGGVPHLKLAL